MSVPYALLGLLEQSPRHGYELKHEYDVLFAPARPLPFGQVYSTLARLKKGGLIEVVSEEPGRGPDRRLYAITESGVSDLREWARQPEPAEPYVHNILFTKVVLSLLSGLPVKRFLNSQRSIHQEKMRELTVLKEQGDLVTTLLADYALFHLEADLKWIDIAEARLGRLRREMRR